MAAHTLRQHGFVGRLTLVDPDHAAPYERPMLSKQFLGGKVDADRMSMGGEDWAEKNHIERRYSHAVSVVPDKHQLIMERGDPLEYNHLIVATGHSLEASICQVSTSPASIRCVVSRTRKR